MKNNKMAVAIVMAIFLLVASPALAGIDTMEAAAAENTRLVVTNTAGKAGAEVTVSVLLENNPGIAVYGIVMQYNPATLTFVAATTGDIFPANDDTFRGDWRLSDSQIRILDHNPRGGLLFSGITLFTVTLRINEGVGAGVLSEDNLRFAYVCPVRDGFATGRRAERFEIVQGTVTVEPPILCTMHIPGGRAAASAATCLDEGVWEIRCAVCTVLLDSGAIGTTNHAPSDMGISRQPTCLETGVWEVRCAVCDILLESGEIGIKDHTPGGRAVSRPATCLEEGAWEVRCAICSFLLESGTINRLAPEHTPGVRTEARSATYIEEGVWEIRCVVCNEVVESGRIDRIDTAPIMRVFSPFGWASSVITFNVAFLHNPGIEGFDFVMQYDPNIFAFVDMTNGNMFAAEYLRAERISDNQVRFAASNPDGSHSIQGSTLFSVRLHKFGSIVDRSECGVLLKFFYQDPSRDGFLIRGETVQVEMVGEVLTYMCLHTLLPGPETHRITSLRIATPQHIQAPSTVTVGRKVEKQFGVILNTGARSDGVVWRVSNTNIASVDADGRVTTFDRIGSVILTASDPESGLQHNIALRIT